MSVVKLKEKYQVTLPASVRQKAGVTVGDLLEAKVEGKKITLARRVVAGRESVSKRLAEGLEDLKKGRTYGPFSSAKDLVRSLHREAKKLK